MIFGRKSWLGPTGGDRALVLGAVLLGLPACAADVQLGFDGCRVDKGAVAVGAQTVGPCGESCTCLEDGSLACGPSLCPVPPTPTPIPCELEGRTIAPGTTVRIDASCVDCSCPAEGSVALAPGEGCTPVLRPACMNEPFCAQRTPDTCDTCGTCTCFMPEMGFPAPPGCLYPEEGMCTNGDYCGPMQCISACPPSGYFPLEAPGCLVVQAECTGDTWSYFSICECGVLDPNTCDPMMMMPQPGCRVDASCDPMQMVPTCVETCNCVTEMDCQLPDLVFDPDPMGSCGRCLPCASCAQLQCPQGSVCVDDPQLACGTCIPG